MTDIATQAFLVRPAIALWTASKLDKAATRSTREAAGANAKSGVRVYKQLVAADALEAVKTIAGAARLEHRKRTVPWSYEGPGAITAVGYPAYAEAMATFEKDFNAAVRVFLGCYDRERESQRGNLGSMFNETDYPPSADLAAKFSFSVSCEPMPQSGDFRVTGLSQANADAIRADIDTKFRAAVAAAQQEAWDRIVARVTHLQTKLRDYKPAEGDTKAQGVFRDTLVTNIQELINVLPSLNISNDPELTAIAVRLQRELCAETAEDLRNSEALRDQVADKAQSIMQEIWAKRRAGRSAGRIEQAAA